MARLSEILSDVVIRDTNLFSDREAGQIRTNSFEVTPGDIFVCVKGASRDGHDFICVAYERGASMIIAERVTPYLSANPAIPCIIVESTRKALSHMWNTLCGRPSDRMIFVAVTGTNGKTSTTYFLREIFRKAGYVTGLVGTVKCLSGERTDIIGESGVNSMTTPPPEKLYPELRKMADDGVEIVFLEASSHALSQDRLDPIRFELSVFTNLTPEHLDYHGDMESYFEAKLKLLALSKAALVNADDGWMAKIPGIADIPTATYSVKNESDFRAENAYCATKLHGVGYILAEREKLGERRFGVTCPLDGEFTVYNTLAAVSAARLFGIEPEVIREALSNCPRIPGRMEFLDVPERLGFEVCLDFAHTPDALGNTLSTLRRRVSPGGRLIVVFGCGGDRDRTKRPVMGKIASELADLAVITSDNSRSENPRAIIFDIIREITDRQKCRVVEKRAAAISFALGEAKRGDIVLLAGKGHEDYEIDSEGKHPFSERQIVFDTLAKL